VPSIHRFRNGYGIGRRWAIKGSGAVVRFLGRLQTKEQFANSPDLKMALMAAIIEALDAHATMSKQAIDSQAVRDGLKDVLMGPAGLYEALRAAKAG